MPGFHLYRSASTRALAERLVQVVTDPGTLLPPEQDELVVVQGRGMEQWLSRLVAARLGVWAGARFPFPRAAASELASAVLAQPPRAHGGDDALTLAFAVAAVLPRLMSMPEGERVRAYVGDDGARLLAFAQQAAHAMDGYMVYRPALLHAWERGQLTAGSSAVPDEGWQAALWRLLRERARSGAGPHVAGLMDFWDRIRRATGALESGVGLVGVERVSIFAVAAVPPQLMEFMVALGRCIHVHWYAVDPAAECAGSPAPIAASLGASDLASVAALMDMVQSARASGVQVHSETLPALRGGASTSDSALGRFQSLVRTGVPSPPADMGNADRSLVVHACAGPIREAEALHDEVLRAFEDLPGLAPEDIAVLVPDIQAYAPAVEAVFRSGRGVERIPSSVADAVSTEGSALATALIRALQLADGDMGVRSVMEFLALPEVAEKFIPGASARHVLGWLMSAGARRFLDAGHREQAGLPATDEGTWELALTRLYAGLAGPPASLAPVGTSGVYMEQPAGVSAGALGTLSGAVELLRSMRALATSPSQRTVAEWMDAMQTLVERIAPSAGDGERQARALRLQLADIATAADDAGLGDQIPFQAMRALLLKRLDIRALGRGFLAGGVTVCQFVPMRAIPFRVVCMVGMDDASFPRASARPSFDLMAQEQLPGDRDARAEDRALILQSVLGAEDRVVVTYTARDAQQGKERPICAAVAEVLEAAPGARLVHQPLHAFSIGAFDASAQMEDRVGYDAAARAAADRLQRAGAVHEARPFIRVGNAPAGVALRQDVVTIEELVRFFRAPARATLREWGLALPQERDSTPDQEMVGLEDIERGLLRRRILDQAMERDGTVDDRVVARLQQQGELPIGEFGRIMGERVLADARAALRMAYPTGAQWQAVDIRVNGVRVVGRVPVESNAVAMVLSGDMSPARRIDVQVAHAACAAHLHAHGHGAPVEARVVCAGSLKTPRIQATDGGEATRFLGQLVALWRHGLQRGIPFFPELSAKAASALGRGEPEDAVVAAADPEKLTADERVLFRSVDPFTVDVGEIPTVGRATFATIARCIYGPPGGQP